MNFHHGHRLRSGRVSQRYRPYHVTFSTRGRVALFSDAFMARAVCRALHRSDKLGATHSWCYMVMPDHVHWLLSLPGEHSLSQVVRMAKGQASQMAGLSLWQKGFYDHALRQEDDILHIARYVIANPLRAGLTDRVANYPYWNAVWL